jgi:hypothetical protein
MVMRYRVNQGVNTITNTACRTLYLWLDFMRTASPDGPGWSIPRSSNVVETNVDQDNIASYNDLTTAYSSGVSVPWFVLRAPDGREILFFRLSVYSNEWSIYHSLSAGFTGGDKGNQPSATDQKAIKYGSDLHTDSGSMIHMGADDAAPYAFWMWIHGWDDFAVARFSMALIPILASTQQAGDIDPVVFWQSYDDGPWDRASMADEDDSGTSGWCIGYIPATTSWREIPAWYYRNEADISVPNGCQLNSDSKDFSFPIPFGRSSGVTGGGYKGFADFVQWNGTARAAGVTFAGRTRISVGDCNVPWPAGVLPRKSI